MAYSCYAAHEIANASPPQSGALGNLLMGRNDIGIICVNVFRPLLGVLVISATEPGEERELQMVVRIDESGEEKIASEVDVPGFSLNYGWGGAGSRGAVSL